MKTYKVLVTSVDYSIEDQDVCHIVDNDPSIEEDSEEYYEEIEKIKEDIRSKLPQKLNLEVTCYKEDLEDMIADAISQETFWLINSFTYELQ